VKPLVHHFLAKLAWDAPAARAIDPDALDAIAAEPRSANVRELRVFVERVAKLAEGASITRRDVDFVRLVTDRRVLPDDDAPLEGFKEAKRSVVDEFERTYVQRLLARAGTNVSRAAALAGLDRQSLRSLLRRHGLRGPD
jgi:DNA-binding NtrC family response regulator